MLFKILSVFVLGATSVVSTATPTVTSRSASINPPLSLSNSNYRPVAQVETRELTNGQRLAAGLPLKPPTRRHAHIARAQPSGAPGQTLTKTARGYIECLDQDGQSLGFIGKDQNPFGEYGLLSEDDASDRLLVTIDLDSAASGPTDIQTLNGPDADLPLFGGLKGFASNSSDIMVGSWNHFFVGGTTQTSPNSPPFNGSNTFSNIFNISEQVESAIWKYDTSSNIITPQWINTDSSSPTTYAGLLRGMLVCTGDKDAFANYYGTVDWVTLSLVSA